MLSSDDITTLRSFLRSHRSMTGMILAVLVAIILGSLFSDFGMAEDWPEHEAFVTGTSYIFPKDGKQDVAAGVALIRKAADAGNPKAKYALAMLHRHGKLVKKDRKTALVLLESAADMGLPEAQTVLGQEILERLGPYDSPDAGRDLLRQAAKAGVTLAHYYLGKSFMFKDLKNYDLAIKHLTIAAEGGIVEAQLFLGIAYTNGGGLYRSMAPPNYERGFHWIQKATEGGNALAWTWVGWAYEDGKAVPQNLTKAAEAWRRAAEMGESTGAKALALAYRKGVGVAKNRRLENYWMHHAAEMGDPGAKEAIARQQRQNGQVLAALILLGLAMGGSADQGQPNESFFMDPSDPMQAWGMDIMMQIK